MRSLVFEEPFAQSALWARRLALLGVALGASAVGLIRFEKVDVALGLSIFGAAAFLCCAALLTAAAACVVIWRTGWRGFGAVALASFLALGFLAYPAYLAVQSLRHPVLNDVATDVLDPPQYFSTQKARDARGGRVYAEPSIVLRQAQRANYPDIQPILLELEPEEAYQLVMKAAQALRWRIVDVAPPSQKSPGRIDAIDRTLVMALPDDIAIRIRPVGGQSKIDVRSASRYGRNDFGTNAARIEAFAQAVQDQLDAR
jgi:uncharacterized protein (DUF1499 family)